MFVRSIPSSDQKVMLETMAGVYRLRARTDANQDEIIAALRAVGAAVFYIRWPFDLLVAFRGQLYILECKAVGEHLGGEQQIDVERLDDKGVSVYVVRSVIDALKAIRIV